MNDSGRAIIERLEAAINAHDVEAIAACFTSDVHNVQPAHPARGFSGREQIWKNWSQILAGVPDLRAELVGCNEAGDRVWAEWAWNGTRHDGARFEMRGVTIQHVRAGQIASVRFYMEPVDRGSIDVTSAIRSAVGA
jgi:ketosteroid isomerase-like protein